MEIKAWDRDMYGKFYTGDAYIVLQVREARLWRAPCVLDASGSPIHALCVWLAIWLGCIGVAESGEDVGAIIEQYGTM